MLFRELSSRHGFVSRWEPKAVETLAYVNRHQGCIPVVFVNAGGREDGSMTAYYVVEVWMGEHEVL